MVVARSASGPKIAVVMFFAGDCGDAAGSSCSPPVSATGVLRISRFCWIAAIHAVA